MGETVIFPTVTYNEGSGYNNSTGKFTAPVSGLYAFAKQTCEAPDTYSYTAFVHNGQSVLSSMNTGPPNYHTCYGAQVFVRMARGDQMWVGIVSRSQFYYNSQLQPSFSGSLIHGW